jgi:3-hydroxyacyl-CoA dehydrogenase
MSKKVAMIGAGLVGRAWAISFARGGYDVVLYDAAPGMAAKSAAAVAGPVEELERQELLRGSTKAEVLARISGTDNLAEAVAGTVHIQENVPENLDLKRKVFAELDPVAPADAVLCSSTSALLPSKFTDGLKGRHRCIVAHPINPPYLVPCVELLPAPWTTPETVERTRAIMAEIGQAPILMKKELDGFIMNRLQGALLHEAMRLVAGGYATPEDIDTGICKGIGLRWAFMGPFETIDLNAPGGIRDYITRYEALNQNMAKTQAAPVAWAPLIDELERRRDAALPRARLAERSLWRDKRLMALAVHKAQAERDFGK